MPKATSTSPTTIEASLAFPDDVVMNSKGELFIADAGNDVVRRLRNDGTTGGFMAGSRLSVMTDQSWNGRSWTVLQEEAAGVRIHYFVDPESHLIWRTVHRDATSDAVVCESWLSSVEL